MSASSFDPRDAIHFDLQEGAVSTRAGTKLVVLSAEAVGAFIGAAGAEGGVGILRTLGDTLGGEALASLGTDANGATFSAVMEHIAGWLRVGGWGKLGIERWADALVVEFVSTTVNARAAERLLEGLLCRVSGRQVACVHVQGSRFLILDPAVAATARACARDGMRLGEIVADLEIAG